MSTKEHKIHLEVNGRSRCAVESDLLTRVPKRVTCGKCKRMVLNLHQIKITGIAGKRDRL